MFRHGGYQTANDDSNEWPNYVEVKNKEDPSHADPWERQREAKSVSEWRNTQNKVCAIRNVQESWQAAPLVAP